MAIQQIDIQTPNGFPFEVGDATTLKVALTSSTVNCKCIGIDGNNPSVMSVMVDTTDLDYATVVVLSAARLLFPILLPVPDDIAFSDYGNTESQ